MMDLTDNKSALVQVMARCRQATSHNLSQCWPRFMMPYGVTRQQWVNSWRQQGSCTSVTQIYVIWYCPNQELMGRYKSSLVLQNAPSSIMPWPLCHEMMLKWRGVCWWLSFTEEVWYQLTPYRSCLMPLNICCSTSHDDVITWKWFMHYWPFVYGIQQLLVTSWHGNAFYIAGPLCRESSGDQWIPSTKDQQCNALMIYLL